MTPEARHAARKRLAGLHVLADDDPRWKRDPVEQARAACAGGAAVVQLRAKRAIDREAVAWGRAIRTATRRSGTLCVSWSMRAFSSVKPDEGGRFIPFRSKTSTRSLTSKWLWKA